MRVAVIEDELPVTSEGASGSDVTAWSIVRSLVHAGHRVRLCLTLDAPEAGALRARSVDLDAFRSLGVDVTVVETGSGSRHTALRRAARLARRIVRSTLADFYPGVDRAQETRLALVDFKPDVIVGFPVTAIAWTHGLTVAPRVALFGDVDHLIPRYRWRATPLRPLSRFVRATLRVLATREQWKYTKEILLACDGVINFVPHHTTWLREHGVPQIVHVALPTVDLAGRDWQQRRAAHHGTRPRILMVGSLTGTATVPGLYVLARGVLPRLERDLGPDGFDLHIVGRHDPPADLRDALARPSVNRRGYVEYLSPEFLSADVVFVPTPMEVGIRVRIIVAASYGCCVVAHRANLMGTPEFQHERDILVGSDAGELADQIIRALRDEACRRRIGIAARDTYERCFAIETAGRRLVAAIEGVVSGLNTPAVPIAHV